MQKIPFNRAMVPEAAFEYLRQAVGNLHLSGDGPFTRRCHALLEQMLHGSRVLLTTSCTHALEMAALLLDIGPDDEVIVPDFTFVSTVNAFVLRGARPVFADVRRDTLNLDEAQLERLITRRTRAIVPVHYAGVACEMDTINAVAARHGVAVVEDNAHGLCARYRGRPLGTLGTLATQSFHETKNFSCGEGGALVINDERYVERSEILREKGTDRSRFFRGQVDKYGWVDVGSSYLPSDALAAMLCAALEARDEIQNSRMRVWRAYEDGLGAWAADNGVRLPMVPDECDHPAHLFYLLMPSLEDRQRLIARLASEGISAVFHYQPLHLSQYARRYGGRPGDCPVTEAVSDRLVRLPLFPHLSDLDQARVLRAVKSYSTCGDRGQAVDVLFGDRRRRAA